MKNVLNIVKKELDKIFKSPRLIISTFLLPAILIFIMYSLMGTSAKSQSQKLLEHEYKVVNITSSSSFNDILVLPPYNIKTENLNEDVTINDLDQDSNFYNKMYESMKNGDTDVWVYCDTNFDEIINGTVKGETVVKVYTHTKNEFSNTIGELIEEIINSKVSSLNEYQIDFTSLDLATETEQNASILAIMAPMLIMTFIFAGALSIGSDSIAGEKERGTIATMLMAPISKDQIILGKIVSAIILTIISSICSFIGLMASLSNYLAAFGNSDIVFTMSFGPVCELLVIIILISLLAVSLFLVASTFAKSTKEATMYAMPIYLIGIISGVFTMFNTSIPTSILPYFIPIYNLTLGLKGIFMNELLLKYFLVILGSNLIYFIIILTIVKQMFKSEKIMFNR